MFLFCVLKGYFIVHTNVRTEADGFTNDVFLHYSSGPDLFQQQKKHSKEDSLSQFVALSKPIEKHWGVF